MNVTVVYVSETPCYTDLGRCCGMMLPLDCSVPTPEPHCVSEKVPTFKLFVNLSNLNQFSKFLHCWKVHEIATKPIQR